MTEQKAIDRIEDHMQVHKIGQYPHIKLKVALDMAIAALRAQQDHVKLDRSGWERCTCCKTYGFGAVVFDGQKYCGYCGRPLTEEAWAELERRISGGKAD